MLNVLLRLDRTVAWSRPAWLWLGQLALVILGVHLAADRLDDRLADLLAGVQVAWPTPESPLVVATWSAVVLELALCVWAARTLWHARAEPVRTVGEWGRRASIHAILAPLAWLPLCAAGIWVVYMAVEDAAAPFLLDYAGPVALAVAALAAWRLGISALDALVRRTPVPRRRLDGVVWLVPVAVVAVLAAQHGVPVWGWLQ